jgi:hypothetical protein
VTGELLTLAEHALEGLAPLRFDVAHDERERDAVHRMRCDCVLAEGWARAEDFPDGRERDADDARASFVVCRDGDTLGGSMRIVEPLPGEPLPAEREFGIRARPTGEVVEVGRLIVAPGVRAGRSHRILGGLCARGWMLLAERGYERAISTATPTLIELYSALGLQVTVLAPARLSWGARRAPIAIEGGPESFAFLTRSGG